MIIVHDSADFVCLSQNISDVIVDIQPAISLVELAAQTIEGSLKLLHLLIDIVFFAAAIQPAVIEVLIYRIFEGVAVGLDPLDDSLNLRFSVKTPARSALG